MSSTDDHLPPTISRRTLIQAGAIGLGLNTADLTALRALGGNPQARAKSVIFIFLTGGLSHHDTFDMKPDAPLEIRGEFGSIATRTQGLRICEHLPLLASRSDRYSLVRSMKTASNGHEVACHMLLTGRLDLPPGFSLNQVPSSNEWPSIPALVTYASRHRENPLPPAAVLPQPSVNEANKVRPGQYAGRLGERWEAWHLDIAAKCAMGNGACPDCFRFGETGFEHGAETVFDTPTLSLPEGGLDQIHRRVGLLATIEKQQGILKQLGHKMDRHRQQAISVLTDPQVSSAFNVENAPPDVLERYGANKFGLSLLMAKRLVESGVRLVQVNLGKNSSWDTHRANFGSLKDHLLPPTDRAVAALLDDLEATGLLDETLVVMTGEFGRTPIINKDAGRDHWGQVNTMLFAGGGVRGGNIVGASDRTGAEVTHDIQKPENFAATIYDALGIPRTARWQDIDGRFHPIYMAKRIEGLYA
jgi:hypothetical protein